MADDVEFALDELDGSDFEAIRGHSATLRTAIATLRADMAKAVEGFEWIEKRATELRNGTDDWFELVEFQFTAQSLIKELRP